MSVDLWRQVTDFPILLKIGVFYKKNVKDRIVFKVNPHKKIVMPYFFKTHFYHLD